MNFSIDAAVLAAGVEALPDGLHGRHDAGVHGVHHHVGVAFEQAHHGGQVREGGLFLRVLQQVQDGAAARAPFRRPCGP